MCKLLAFSLSQQLEQKRVWEVIRTAKELLKDQKDGFGYALSGGELKGMTHCRLTNSSFLGYGYAEPKEWGKYVSSPYQAKGKVAPCTAGIFHGRTSTNDLGVENTHPFVNAELALAHNGIVEYTGPDRPKLGTCDSEDLFNSFTMGDGWSELSKYYSGYCALLLLRKGGHLTIYRDESPSLHICKVRHGVVIGTTIHDVTSLARKLDETPNAPWVFQADTAVSIVDGKIVASEEVEPMPRRSYGYKDSLSLGSTHYTSQTTTTTPPTSTPATTTTPTPTAEAFPDYDKSGGSVDKYSPEWEDGYQFGYEDGLVGRGESEVYASDSPTWAGWYAEGYKDGILEKQTSTPAPLGNGADELFDDAEY